MNNFGIQIEDEHDEVKELATSQNTKFFQLYEWQKQAIKHFWDNNGCDIFEITTGAGKTYCAIEIIKQILARYSDAYILIVVPKNVILEKGWFPELYKNGYTMKDVGVFYGMAKEYNKITITNMQNVMNINFDVFEFIIFDEIHNYCTPRLFKMLEHPFKFKLGLSATIERMDKAHWRMLAAFNYNRYIYTPKQALNDDVLNKFNFFNIGVTLDYDSRCEYDVLTQEINVICRQGGGRTRIMRGEAGEDLRNALFKKNNERKQKILNYLPKMEVMKQICLKHKNEKILVFNEFNKITRNAYLELLDVGIKAEIIHSGIKKQQREQTLNDYAKDKFNVLLATKILDEGYNLPKIGTAIIQAGNSTPKQTIQRLGRVLRKKEDISNLYQIYVDDTFESDQAMGRAKLFKELCTEYKEYRYEDNALREL